MADTFNATKRSQIMAAVKSTGNRSTEERLVKLFRRYGIVGWRRGQPLIGKPDFTFRKQKAVIFVDGCFWHGCLLHLRIPKTNEDYWRRKIERNRKRDRDWAKQLRREGWKVLRLWEHELKEEAKTVRKVRRFLARDE